MTNEGETVEPEPKRTRSKSVKVEERRKAVTEFLTKGISQGVIAELLGVHKNTVWQDVKIIKTQNAALIRELNRPQELGDTLSFLSQIESKAMLDADATKSDVVKKGFLQVALDARKARIELMQDMNILPKKPLEIDVGTDILTASKEELEERKRDLIKKYTAQPKDFTSN